MRDDHLAPFIHRVPPLRLRDPLAELLGAVPEGRPITYTFADAVRLAGHACPTVASAWLITAAGLEALYADELPVRGEIAVAAMGAPEQFGYGPMAQVIAGITGAAGDTGFRGLAGRFGRAGLLTFHPDRPALATFELSRRDTGASVRVAASADAVPAPAELRPALQGALAGDPDASARFRTMWLARVEALLDPAIRDRAVRVEVLASRPVPVSLSA